MATNAANVSVGKPKVGGAISCAPLGRGYALSPYVGKTRPNVMIYAESFHARLENLTNNTILKAVQGK